MKRSFKSTNKFNFKKPSITRGWLTTFFAFYITGILEELCEEGVAYGISWAFSTVLSKTLIATGITIALGVSIKQLLIMVIKPIVKKYTYKEGTDKLMKAKDVFEKILRFVKANWQTGLGLGSLIYLVLENAFNWVSTACVNAGLDGLVYILIVPLAIFIVNGLAKQGFETPEIVEARLKARKDAKNEADRIKKLHDKYEFKDGKPVRDADGHYVLKEDTKKATEAELEIETLKKLSE